ncbi:hypothetical protein F4778DRAFT_777055 [Xylariomycetidae sp. FL2044]|nr:hypothetical protein F4778DRAFT_777055 [Xylariomycetidae sp. FL2044]
MAPPNAEKPVGRDDEDGIVQEEKYGGGGIASLLAVEDGGVYNPEVESRPGYLQTLLDAAVEENRIKPVPRQRCLVGYLDTAFIEELVVCRKVDISTFSQSIWNFGRSCPQIFLPSRHHWFLWVLRCQE